MITRINAKNADQYNALFDKATALLKAKEPATISNILDGVEGMTWDNFGIGSLNEYYAYLEDILKIEDLTEDEKAFYVRLPLDEDVFAINADTRTISVPSNFSRYGVGVQGDESAEVVYFTIARYFDSMDLAGDDVQIRIQWEARDADKQLIKGISKNFGKDIETEAQNGLMIFGWPISSKLTQTNGKIKFAVRFFKINEDNQLSYSFTTLPAEVTINASLDYNMLERMENELDDGQNILSRIKSSGIYDNSFPIPAEPIITTDLYVYDPVLDNVTKIVDLPPDDSPIKLAISAKPGDTGIIEYVWKNYRYDDATGTYSSIPNIITTGIETTEIQQTEAIAANDQERYYTKTSENGVNKYTWFDLADLRNRTPDGETHKFETEAGNYIELYKLYSTLTIENNSTAAGIYTVDIKARNLINSKSKEMAIDDGINIPGPKQPEITAEDTHVIAENGVATLIVDAQRNSEEQGTNPNVLLTYSWGKIDDDSIVPIEGGSNPGEVPVALIPAEQLFREDTEGRQDKIAQNLANVILIQNGNDIHIYKNGDYAYYTSTDPGQAGQGDVAWLALDINLKDKFNIDEDGSVDNLFWGPYAMTGEEHLASLLDLEKGHIVFWPVLATEEEDIAWNRTVRIGTSDQEGEGEEIFLTFHYHPEHAAELTYSYNDNNKELIIQGLDTDGDLDLSYVAMVQAERNKISTTANSPIYRITNEPQAPELTIRDVVNGQWVNLPFEPYTEKTYGYNSNLTLRFSVNPEIKSDALTYIWMRMNTTDPINDTTPTGEIKIQADLDGLIAGLDGFNPEGEADYPAEIPFAEQEPLSANILGQVRKALDKNSLIALGELQENNTNGPIYQVKPEDRGSTIYCIVINELNAHYAASLSPFYKIS